MPREEPKERNINPTVYFDDNFDCSNGSCSHNQISFSINGKVRQLPPSNAAKYSPPPFYFHAIFVYAGVLMFMF